MGIAVGCVLVLVILGGIILNRTRSGDGGSDTVVSDRLPGAGTDDATGAEGSAGAEDDTSDLDDSGSADSADDSPDICELLPQDVASSLAGTDLQRMLSDTGDLCRYRGGGSSEDPRKGVTLEAKQTGFEPGDDSDGMCPSVLADCDIGEAPVPALPDGRVWWWEPLRPAPGTPEPQGGWPDWMDDTFVDIRVEWTAADRVWSLRFSDDTHRTEDVILSVRDDVIAEAEKVHRKITADPDRWVNL